MKWSGWKDDGAQLQTKSLVFPIIYVCLYTDGRSDTTTTTDIEQSSLPVTQQQQMKVSYPPDIVTSSMKERPKDLPGVQAVNIGILYVCTL